MMLPSYGNKLTGGLPRSVELVRELEAFEGPILSQYRAVRGAAVYVEKWCTTDASINRYLLVRSEQRAIAEFLGGRMSMLNLLKEASDGIGFLIDRHHTATVSVSVAAIADLPRSYMPTPSRMHDELLRPDWEMVPQDYLIDDGWDAKQLATIERHYLNAAGFAYLTKPKTERQLPPRVLGIDYDGGYPIMHAFNSIRAQIPAEARARAVGVSANSPGVLSIEAPAETAGQLREALRALPRSLIHYHNVHEWSKLTPDQAEDVPSTAYKTLVSLCESLGVDPSKLLTGSIDDKGSLLVAGKLVAAYYRVLRRVHEPVQGVEFMGIQPEETSHIESVEIEDDDDEQISIAVRRVRS